MEYNRLISAAETAGLLGISTASVRNWIRHGYLKKENGGFSETEVRSLLEKIRRGELNRLGRRANKREAAGNITEEPEYAELCGRLAESDTDSGAIMWAVSLWLFRMHGLAADKPLNVLACLNKEDFSTGIVNEHLVNGLRLPGGRSSSAGIMAACGILEDYSPDAVKPADRDAAGIIYQAVSNRGMRSVSGSFYTPSSLTSDLIGSSLNLLDPPVQRLKFIDPCCGSGQFMLAFIKAGGLPEYTWGMDSDPVASFIAGTNILLQCPEIRHTPRIFCRDSLLEGLPPEYCPDSFDIAVTNPPWGAVVKADRNELEKRYPSVTSGESFSFFICRCLELVSEGGAVTLLLPESVTNVKRHSDVRKHILRNSMIRDITNHGRAFRAVYTRVVSLELQKTGRSRKQEMDRSELAFNININTRDIRIIDSIYSLPHRTLKDRADWALGIVTGDNNRFLSDIPGDNYEPVIRGSDIRPGIISRPKLYIRFEPEKFQQTAPLWKYRSKEKLVYRFISRRLVFAPETCGFLTINSANILLPDMEKLSDCKLNSADIIRLFNSDLYNFIYQKRFNSVKVLRSHLEQLPLPEDPGALLRQFGKSDLEYIGNSV